MFVVTVLCNIQVLVSACRIFLILDLDAVTRRTPAAGASGPYWPRQRPPPGPAGQDTQKFQVSSGRGSRPALPTRKVQVSPGPKPELPTGKCHPGHTETVAAAAAAAAAADAAPSL